MAANLLPLPSGHQSIVDRLDLMLRSRYPLIYIVGAEEEPIETVLMEAAARSTPQRELYLWDIVRGWSDNGADKGSAIAALGRIAKSAADKAAIYVLRDLHPVLKAPW